MQKVFLFFAVVALVGLTGCLEFDAQEVHLRYDRKADQLDALLIYRGLYSDADDLQKAIDQLATVQRGDRWIALGGNFPFAWNFDQIDGDNPILKAVAREIRVSNGPLWRDGEGKLCGCQFVRMTRVSAILDVSNKEFMKQFDTIEKAKTFLPDDADPDSAELMMRAAQTGHRFFQFRGSALRFSMPLSDVGARAVRLAILGELRESIENNKDDDKKEVDQLLEFLARNDCSIDRAGNDLTFTIGNPRRPKVLLDLLPREKYDDKLLKELVARKWDINEDYTIAAARKAFADFCAEK